MTHPLLKGRPFILETPIEKAGDDARNVATLWKLAGFPIKVSKKKGSPSRRKSTTKKSERAPGQKRKTRPNNQRKGNEAEWITNRSVLKKSGRRYGKSRMPFVRWRIRRAPSVTCWRCCHTLPARCTWATCGITRWATRWRATSDSGGNNVLHPMGWDSPGLPAENAAIKQRHTAAGVDPLQHRADEIGLQAIRFQRTGAGKFPPANRNTIAGTMVAAHMLERGPGLPQEEPGETASGVPDGSSK